MNKQQIADEIKATEERLTDLRKRLSEPEEWTKHRTGAVYSHGPSYNVTLFFDTLEQAEYARGIIEPMNFNHPPGLDEAVIEEDGLSNIYRRLARFSRDARWHMGLIKRAK